MDPNANLREQADLLADPHHGSLHNYDRYRLHDLRIALRDWLQGGGFAPDWDRYPAAAANFKRWQGSRA